MKAPTTRSLDAVAARPVAVLTFAYRYLSFERFPDDQAGARQILEQLSREGVPLVILDSESITSTMQEYPRVAASVTQRYYEIGRFDASQGRRTSSSRKSAACRFDRFGNLPCFASPEQGQLSRSQ